MFKSSKIILQNISYCPQNNDQEIFTDLSLTFDCQKIGLVGRNGIGKSTLLKLIVRELKPNSGQIITRANIAYCPQDLHRSQNINVAQILGVEQKLKALERITKGSTKIEDFEILNDDWQVLERTEAQLAKFGLKYIDVNRKIATLSGGEQARLVLVRTFLIESDFIILDEPTNNLDLTSKEFLYQAIKEFKGGLLVVSHDRTLLNLLNSIVEITSIGVQTYGGNYDYYLQQKGIHKDALDRQILDAKRQEKKLKNQIQKNQEKQAQRAVSGKKLRTSGSQPKMVVDSLKEKSAKTQSRITKSALSQMKQQQEKMKDLKEKQEKIKPYSIDLSLTKIPNNKLVVELENINFTYPKTPVAIIQDFSLKLVGPERIAILGDNGSGKSTLINIITGKLKAQSGLVKIGVDRIHYLDQHAISLDTNLTILENFQKFNSKLTEYECRLNLAQFLFRANDTLKLIKNLSGGEKLRALLACVLMAKNPPKLLILDEPTNNLDLECIEVIENILNEYQGALIIISHDQTFLENIGIKKFYTLGS